MIRVGRFQPEKGWHLAPIICPNPMGSKPKILWTNLASLGCVCENGDLSVLAPPPQIGGPLQPGIPFPIQMLWIKHDIIYFQYVTYQSRKMSICFL